MKYLIYFLSVITTLASGLVNPPLGPGVGTGGGTNSSAITNNQYLPGLPVANAILFTNINLPVVTVSGNPFDFTNNAQFGPWTPGTKTMGLQEAINSLPLASSILLTNGFGGGRVQIVGTLQLATNIWIPNTNPFHLYIKGYGAYKSKIQYTNTANLDMFVVQTNYPRSYVNGRTLTMEVEDCGFQYFNNNTNYIFNLYSLNTFASKRCFYFQNFYFNGFVETDPTNIPGVVAFNFEPAQSDQVYSEDDKFYNLAAGAYVQCDHALFVRPMFYNIGVWYSNTVIYTTNLWGFGPISSCAAVINSSTFADVNVDSAVFVNVGVSYYAGNSTQPTYYPSYLINCRFDGVLGSSFSTRVLTRDNIPIYIQNPTGLLITDAVSTNDMLDKVYASNIKPARVFSSNYRDLKATRLLSVDSTNNIFSVDYSGNLTNAGFVSMANGSVYINPNITYTTNMYVWGAGTAGINGNYYRTNSISDASSIEWTNPVSGYFFLIDPDNVILPVQSQSAFLSSARVVIYGWPGSESSANPFSLFNIWYDFTTNSSQSWGNPSQFTGSRPLVSGAYISIYPTVGTTTLNVNGNIATSNGPPSYVQVGSGNGLSNSVYSKDGSNSLQIHIGGALAYYGTNVSGTVSNNMPGPLSAATYYGLPTLFLAGNVVQTNGILTGTNSTAAGQSWWSLSGDSFSSSNGTTQIKMSMTPSNINLGGLSAGSVVMFGNQFALSNSWGTISGSNDVYGVTGSTNWIQVTNSLNGTRVTILAQGTTNNGTFNNVGAAGFSSTVGIGGLTTFTNNFVIPTNSIQEGTANLTLDAQKGATFITTNANFAISGIANLQPNMLNWGWLIVSNSSASVLQGTFGTGWVVDKPVGANLGSTWFLTNGVGLHRAIWSCIPGAGSNVNFWAKQ